LYRSELSLLALALDTHAAEVEIKIRCWDGKLLAGLKELGCTRTTWGRPSRVATNLLRRPVASMSASVQNSDEIPPPHVNALRQISG
jgi:hypothetical protein